MKCIGAYRFSLVAFLLQVSLGVLIGPSYAADAKGNFSVRGLGSFKCSAIVKEMDANTPSALSIIAWIDGVISASNKYEKDTYDLVVSNDPPLYVPTLIVNYCRQHADALLDSAVHIVLDYLKPGRVKIDSPMIDVTADQRHVKIRAETLKLVEERLIKLAYLKGSAQGKFSPKLGKAIGDFQDAKKIPRTELPDAPTIYKLLLES